MTPNPITSSCTTGAVGALVLAGLLALPACGAGYVEMGGYDAEYATAPIGIEAYPTYTYGGTVVYDADGRYYAHRDGRWVRYRRVPAEVEHWHRERYDHERGRAEHQR